NIAKGAIASGLYSIVVLDELNPVLDLGLLSEEDVVDTLKNKPQPLEMIVTGRAAPQSLLDLANLHSEMKPHKATDAALEGIEIYTGDGKG
ncbi:cob(I)yrinic acid a,c-diamide adenosyltransferase, partial [Bacillus sp. SIMBA_161]